MAMSLQEFISSWKDCEPHRDLIVTKELRIDDQAVLWAYEVKAGCGGYQKDTCVIRYSNETSQGYCPVLAEGFSFSHLKYNELYWSVREGESKGTLLKGNIIIHQGEIMVINHESLGQSFPLQDCQPVR